jgi:two-component system sensor histidine kinase YesM
MLWVSPLKNGWFVVSVATMEHIMKKARQMRDMGTLAVILFSVVFMTPMIVFGNRLARRVKYLVEKMAQFNAETWTSYAAMRGGDEIAMLDRAFLRMGQRLSDSIREGYARELEKKKAELSLLHTQIRPHFLYNMLSSIAWIIDDQPSHVARQAIENLASFYRYSLAKGREIITLGEEIKILSAYMELQALRFKSRVCFLMQVDKLFFDVKIPRMTLQALAENSILHGAGPERRPVAIVLDAVMEGDKAAVLLRDDGVGMDADTVRQINSGAFQSANDTGLGHKMIADRIRLYFGSDYGVKVSSVPDCGTTMCIYLPVSEE